MEVQELSTLVQGSLALVQSKLNQGAVWLAKTIEGFVTGGIAGAVAKTIIAPGDRIKIIYQVTSDRSFDLRSAWKTGSRIVEKDGVGGLWRGHGATLLRIVPYASLSYGTFPHYERVLGNLLDRPVPQEGEAKKQQVDLSDKRAFARRFFSGAAAGATASTLTYPLDLLRARYAAHWSSQHRYPSYFTAVVEIYKLEGWKALYGGLTPTLVGIMPYAGLSFAFFETGKATVMKWFDLKTEDQMRPIQRVCCGAVAALLAQSMTYPLEICRRRMQVHPEQYKSITGTLRMVYKLEGSRGLFKGLTLNWIKGPISAGVSFTVNDELKSKIRRYHTAIAAQPDPEARKVLTLPEKFLCGATAGAMAKFWTSPFDRMKLLYTVGKVSSDSEHTNPYDGLGQKIRDLHSASTTRSGTSLFQQARWYWRGSGAMMIRVVPFAAITYGSFDTWKDVWKRASWTPSDDSMPINFLAGASAASLATMLLHPIDVLRTHKATHELFQGRDLLGSFPSYRVGLRELYRLGGVSAMYTGWKAAIIGIAPLAGICWAIYEYIKYTWECETFSSYLMAGAVAAWGGQVTTYPLNIVRRRAALVVERGIHRPSPKGVISSIYKIAAREGFFHGLYGRMPMGWVFGTTSISLSFAVNDTLKQNVMKFREALYA